MRHRVGKASDLDIGTFLGRGPSNAEHEALLRLIGTLVDDRTTTATTEDRNATF